MTWPTMTIWLGSIRTPMRAVTRLGVPQPSSSIGPMTKPPALNGKMRAQLVDDLRRVGDRVLREQEAVERSGRQARTERRRVDRVLHAEQAADAGHREAEAELNRRQLRGDDQQQRPAARVLRRQQTDRLDADLHQLDVEDAAVLAARLVEQQEAAALDDAGVDGEARARRWLEAPGCGRGRPAEQVVQIQLRAEPIDRTGEGTDRDLERARDLDVDLVQAGAFGQLESRGTGSGPGCSGSSRAESSP